MRVRACARVRVRVRVCASACTRARVRTRTRANARVHMRSCVRASLPHAPCRPPRPMRARARARVRARLSAPWHRHELVDAHDGRSVRANVDDARR
eukprot:3754015-Pleurochrysis_carterae.AAC.1